MTCGFMITPSSAIAEATIAISRGVAFTLPWPIAEYATNGWSAFEQIPPSMHGIVGTPGHTGRHRRMDSVGRSIGGRAPNPNDAASVARFGCPKLDAHRRIRCRTTRRSMIWTVPPHGPGVVVVYVAGWYPAAGYAEAIGKRRMFVKLENCDRRQRQS